MESPDEELRLELKTDPAAVRSQAEWCGVDRGMKVLDAGCGPGIVTSILHTMVGPSGSITGIDYSEKRIAYAKSKYMTRERIQFVKHDLRDPLPYTGEFDLVWARFVLEYNRNELVQIVANLSETLKPGGLLCLLDLDNNCLNHFPLPREIAAILPSILKLIEKEHNFDQFVGRKLYTLLYDLDYEDIRVGMRPHHLIYGQLMDHDLFNWIKKVEMITSREKELFDGYPEGIGGFFRDFQEFFRNPRRFTYTPLITCTGTKP
jgi:SAM-dependent methyltransferase